ncbi:hypothetical protein [Streptomyces angustmyceticus]|uniref:hypothetical protein n=1 Tax=Streptomyces angustmyceticus TaxID=285578 RepID=UPI00344EF151
MNEAEQQAAPKDAVAVLRAEGRLQKLDFWLRNPDYLADELLNDYEREKEAINLRAEPTSRFGRVIRRLVNGDERYPRR